MPDAATVKVLVEHYGWPLVTVFLLGFILWRVMVKHEGQMTKVNEVNAQIAANLVALAARLEGHDKDEARRHKATRDLVDKRPSG